MPTIATELLRNQSLDLAADSSKDLVATMLRQLRPFAVHMGLPCGTCSRAREKQLPKKFQGSFSDPPPLRSAEHLMGLPGLSGINLTKVNQANRLYKNAVAFLYVCYALNIMVSIENPQRSWLWGVLMQLVVQYNDPAFLQWYSSLVQVDFHACIHGSKRAKKTRLLASAHLYENLAGNAKEIMNIFHGPLRGMDADSNMQQLKRPSILRSYVSEWLNVWLLALHIMG